MEIQRSNLLVLLFPTCVAFDGNRAFRRSGAEGDGVLAPCERGQRPLRTLHVVRDPQRVEARACAVQNDAEAVIVAAKDELPDVDRLPAGLLDRGDLAPVQAVIVAQE